MSLVKKKKNKDHTSMVLMDMVEEKSAATQRHYFINIFVYLKKALDTIDSWKSSANTA